METGDFRSDFSTRKVADVLRDSAKGHFLEIFKGALQDTAKAFEEALNINCCRGFPKRITPGFCKEALRKSFLGGSAKRLSLLC